MSLCIVRPKATLLHDLAALRLAPPIQRSIAPQGRLEWIMATANPSVFGFLSGSRHARTPGALDLGFERSAALWRNENDHITYDGAEGHTFSLYLEGGHGTRRLDGRPVSGWPDAFCVMPHQHRSEWEITAPFSFVHLYLPAAELSRAFAETFDRDARMLDVAEVTFAHAPRLAAVLRSIAGAIETSDPLTAEAAMTEMIALFLADPRWGGLRRRGLTGGLAAARRTTRGRARRGAFDSSFVPVLVLSPVRDDLPNAARLSSGTGLISRSSRNTSD